mmetsp:Transcript_27936/g.47490  ORF Transcript_27936/g.47490 Transcript_27936/m.47490 type:complete len:511 (-) Transcript_27936:304-1836(-)
MPRLLKLLTPQSTTIQAPKRIGIGYNNTMPHPNCPRRPSIALKHHHQANNALLYVEKSELASQIAYRGDRLKELKCAARSTNNLIRSHYADFIHEVGRNLYPLIVFTDHEVDGPSGVGSTLTLYRSDGSQTKVSPALQTNYELYKTCGHLLLGLSVEVGPYLVNPSFCSVGGDGVDVRDGSVKEMDSELALNSNKVAELAEDVPWKASLTEYLQKVLIFKQALMRASEVKGVTESNGELTSQVEEGNDKLKPSNGLSLPPLDMQGTMLAIQISIIDFCRSCLSMGRIDLQKYEQLNHENFPRIKKCMQAAAKAQADACVRQLIKWKDMMGPQEWRDLYVVIPTVWAVSAENPRKTMMRQIMDEDRIDSHIIVSEHPRTHGEARTLLGRVVSDRSIGRFVFGDETKEQRIKTMGLSSEVDVVQDDALPAIWDALESNGCPVRQNRSSFSLPADSDVLLGGAVHGWGADTIDKRGVARGGCATEEKLSGEVSSTLATLVAEILTARDGGTEY